MVTGGARWTGWQSDTPSIAASKLACCRLTDWVKTRIFLHNQLLVECARKHIEVGSKGAAKRNHFSRWEQGVMRDDDPPKFGALPRKKIRNLSRWSREARRRIRDSPPLRLCASARFSFSVHFLPMVFCCCIIKKRLIISCLWSERLLKI